MDNSKKSGKEQSIYAFFWGSASKIFSYILVLILGNIYLVEEYGNASYFLAVFNVIMTIALFGVPDSIIPWIIKKKDYRSVISFLYFFGFITFIVLLIISFKAPLMLPLSFMVLVILLLNLIFSFMRVNEDYGNVGMLKSILVLFVIIFAICLRNYGSFGILLSYLIGNMIILLISLFYIKNNLNELKPKSKINWNFVREYLVSGIAVSIIIISFSFLGWIDSIILGLMSNMTEVGRYSISSSFSNLITLIPLTLSVFLITRGSGIVSKRLAQEVQKRVIMISYSLSLILSIALAIICPILIKIFFPKYIGIENYIIILLMGIVFYSIYFIIYSFFISRLEVKKVITPIVLAAIVNIILDISLIPSLGVTGICLATVISHLIPLIWLSYKIKFMKNTIIMILLTFFIPASNLMGYYGVILVIIAPILLILLKIVNLKDLEIIIKSLKKVLKFN